MMNAQPLRLHRCPKDGILPAVYNLNKGKKNIPFYQMRCPLCSRKSEPARRLGLAMLKWNIFVETGGND